MAERFKHGIIGFLASESLDALAASNPQIPVRGRLLLKGIHQGSFADTWLAGDKGELALAAQRRTQNPVQLRGGRLSAHEFARPRGVRSGIQLRRPSGDFISYRSDELISPLRQRFNEPGTLRRILKNFPNLQNIFPENLRLDIRVYPQRFQEFVL